jgi:hypothetical protein
MALIFGIQFFHMPAVMLSDESDARDASHSQSTACEMQLKRHYVLFRHGGTFGVRTRPRVAFAFFLIWRLRFAWDLEIGIWDFALGFRATSWMKIKEHRSCGHRS